MPHKDLEVARAYQEWYRNKNKERVSKNHKLYYEKNKEQIKKNVKEYRNKNKTSCAARSKLWRENNKEELEMKARRYRTEKREFLSQKDREEYRTPKVLNQILLRSFGITLEQYNAMNEAQSGLCAICNRPPITKASRLSVDHCHETGKIRGLLCTRCNTGIGMLGDSIQYVESALLYLVSHKNVLANVI